MTAKKIIISILNGGFSSKHNDDININKFLKNIEEDSKFFINIFIKSIKELIVKKYLIIKLKVFQEYYKIMKINY